MTAVASAAHAPQLLAPEGGGDDSIRMHQVEIIIDLRSSRLTAKCYKNVGPYVEHAALFLLVHTDKTALQAFILVIIIIIIIIMKSYTRYIQKQRYTKT